MKKYSVIFCLIAVLVFASFSGCTGQNSGGGSDTISGDTVTILEEILSGADAQLSDPDKLPGSFTDPVTADNSQGMIGLTPAQFDKYVEDAYASTGMIITFAHEIALVKCNDIAAAAEVKKLIAEGFDSNKWICAFPDASLVIDSGSYVLLAVGNKNAVQAVAESFSNIADGNVGEINIFFGQV